MKLVYSTFKWIVTRQVVATSTEEIVQSESRTLQVNNSVTITTCWVKPKTNESTLIRYVRSSELSGMENIYDHELICIQCFYGNYTLSVQHFLHQSVNFKIRKSGKPYTYVCLNYASEQPTLISNMRAFTENPST